MKGFDADGDWIDLVDGVPALAKFAPHHGQEYMMGEVHVATIRSMSTMFSESLK